MLDTFNLNNKEDKCIRDFGLRVQANVRRTFLVVPSSDAVANFDLDAHCGLTRANLVSKRYRIRAGFVLDLVEIL